MERLYVYPFSAIVTVDIADMFLLGLFVKLLRCYEHSIVTMSRRGGDSGEKIIGLSLVGFVGLVIGCLTYSLLLTKQKYPLSLFLIAFPIALSITLIYAVLSSDLCPLVRHNRTHTPLGWPEDEAQVVRRD